MLQWQLLQHAIRQEQFTLEGKVDNKGVEWTLYNLGILYFDQGKLAKSEKMYVWALQGYEEHFHTLTLNIVGNLCLLLLELRQAGRGGEDVRLGAAWLQRCCWPSACAIISTSVKHHFRIWRSPRTDRA
jgi:hypothetical protein